MSVREIASKILLKLGVIPLKPVFNQDINIGTRKRKIQITHLSKHYNFSLSPQSWINKAYLLCKREGNPRNDHNVYIICYK